MRSWQFLETPGRSNDHVQQAHRDRQNRCSPSLPRRHLQVGPQSSDPSRRLPLRQELPFPPSERRQSRHSITYDGSFPGRKSSDRYHLLQVPSQPLAPYPLLTLPFLIQIPTWISSSLIWQYSTVRRLRHSMLQDVGTSSSTIRISPICAPTNNGHSQSLVER